MLLCDETLTWVRQIRTNDGEEYTCCSVKGSWEGKTGIAQTTKGISPQNTYTARIPAADLPDTFIPQKEDYLVRGMVKEVMNAPQDFAGMEYMKITAVSDNRRGVVWLWHWEVNGA